MCSVFLWCADLALKLFCSHFVFVFIVLYCLLNSRDLTTSMYCLRSSLILYYPIHQQKQKKH